jgi:hypothetical protein
LCVVDRQHTNPIWSRGIAGMVDPRHTDYK